MKTELASQIHEYEDQLVGIVRKLPPDRVLLLVDFARFLESQAAESYDPPPVDEQAGTGEETDSREKEWDELFANPEAKRLLREMAREATEDYGAGRTADITSTENGRLAPA